MKKLVALLLAALLMLSGSAALANVADEVALGEAMTLSLIHIYLGDERVIYSHIKNLRKKLGGDYIQTVRGVGYRVDKD